MKPLRGYFLPLLCLLSLTACGQKGPLYLPENKPATTQGQNQ
ncbi:LPS translocon maturation chaperone LptM [Legionella sp. CNM-4043-24]